MEVPPRPATCNCCRWWEWADRVWYWAILMVIYHALRHCSGVAQELILLQLSRTCASSKHLHLLATTLCIWSLSLDYIMCIWSVDVTFRYLRLQKFQSIEAEVGSRKPKTRKSIPCLTQLKKRRTGIRASHGFVDLGSIWIWDEFTISHLQTHLKFPLDLTHYL